VLALQANIPTFVIKLTDTMVNFTLHLCLSADCVIVYDMVELSEEQFPQRAALLIYMSEMLSQKDIPDSQLLAE